MNQFNPRWYLAMLPLPLEAPLPPPLGAPLITPPIGRVTGMPRRPIRRRPIKRSKRRPK